MGIAIGTIVAAIIAGTVTLINSDLQNQFNREQAQINRDWQEKIQDKQNEYNSLPNQVKQAEEAGFSPATAMLSGNGTNFQPSAGVQGVQSPQMVGPLGGIGEIIQAFSQSSLNFENSESVRSKRKFEIDKLIAEKQELVSQMSLNDASAVSIDIANDYLADEISARIENIKQQTHLSRKEEELASVNIDYINEMRSKILPAELDKLLSERDVNFMDIKRMSAEIQSFYKNMELTEAKTRESEVSAELLENQSEFQQLENDSYSACLERYLTLMDAQCRQYGAETNKTEKEARLILWDKFNDSLKGVGSAVGGIGVAVGKAFGTGVNTIRGFGR